MSSGHTFAAAACALVLAAIAGQALAGQAASDPPLQVPPMSGGDQTLPPKYLSVPAFKSCLSTQSQGSYQSWCLPRRKPGQCPAESWASLKALKGGDALPKCGRVAVQPR
jgi:hypothetical protein